MPSHVIFHGTCMTYKSWRLKRRRTPIAAEGDSNMLRKGFAIGIVALACALPASASAANATSHRGAVGSIQLKAHPRLKTHRLISLEFKQHPRLK